MLDDLVAISRAIRRDLEAWGITPERPAKTSRPKKASGSDQCVRGLVQIGLILSPHKPPHPRTVRRLIRQHHLPAFKRPGFGWISTRKALLRWVRENISNSDTQRK